MKINSIGIQSYQHQTQPSDLAARRAEQSTAAEVEKKITLDPQSRIDGSRISVKASGANSDYLTKAERKALDLIFSKFADNGRFQLGGNGASAEPQKLVGRTLDIKA